MYSIESPSQPFHGIGSLKPIQTKAKMTISARKAATVNLPGSGGSRLCISQACHQGGRTSCDWAPDCWECAPRVLIHRPSHGGTDDSLCSLRLQSPTQDAINRQTAPADADNACTDKLKLTVEANSMARPANDNARDSLDFVRP